MTSRNLATRLKRSVERTAPTADWYGHLTKDELLGIVDAFGVALPAGLKREAIVTQVALMAETKDLVDPLITAMINDGYGHSINALVAHGFFVPWPLVKETFGDPDDEDSGASALLEVGLAVIVNLDHEAGLATPPCLHPRLAAAATNVPTAPTATATTTPMATTTARTPTAAPRVKPAPTTTTTTAAPPAAPAPKGSVVRRIGGAAPAPTLVMPAPLPEPPVYVAPAKPAPPPPPRAVPRPTATAPRVVTLDRQLRDGAPPSRAASFGGASAPPATPKAPAKKTRAPVPPPAPTRTAVQVGPDLRALEPALARSPANWELAVRLWSLPDGTTRAVAVVVDTQYGRLQGLATDPTHTDVAAGQAVATALRATGMLPASLRVETQTLKRVVRPMLETLLVQVGRPGAATRKVANAHRPDGAT